MISKAKIRALAQEGHPMLLVGGDRRALLGLARTLHRNSRFAEGPFLIHRGGSRGLPKNRTLSLVGLCAQLFRKAEGGTVYFENVDLLSMEEAKQLYMVLERGEFWDPETEELVPVSFRVLGSAPEAVLEPHQASSLIYRLAERIIRLEDQD